jgi:hypothetical protein
MTDPVDPKPAAPAPAKPAKPATPAKPADDQESTADGPQPTTPAGQLALEAEAPSWLTGLREGTTTLIALVIVAVTMILLWRTFATANGFQEEKDVLLYTLPLLGTILGYYFGRVPAERRAEVSEGKAQTAQRTAEVATAQVSRTQQSADAKMQAVKVKVERAKAMLQSSQSSQSSSGERRGGVLGGGAPEHGAPPPARGNATGAALDELDEASRMI